MIARSEMNAKPAARRKSKKEREALRKKTDEIVKRLQAKFPPDAECWKILDDMYDENGLPK